MDRNITWRKSILVPCWVAQTIVALILVGSAAVTLVAIDQVSDGDISDGDRTYGSENRGIFHTAEVAVGVILAISVVSLLSTLGEEIALCAHHLNPAWYLGSNCIKAAIWVTYLILTLIGVSRGGGSAIGIILPIVICAASVIPVIYAAKLVHQKRMERQTRGHYGAADMRSATPPANNFDTLRADLIAESTRSRASSTHEAVAPFAHNDAYNSRAKVPVTEHYGYRGNNMEMV